jgi:hypothetical protein
MRRTLLCAPILAVALAYSSAVLAQVSAEALFEEGRQALAAGDLETACAKFRASEQIDPAAGTRANLATCEERRGRLTAAIGAWRGALAKLPPGDARVAVIREHVATLETRLPTLVLKLAPGTAPETTVREGDVQLGEAVTYGVPLPLDPGLHHLVVAAPGRLLRSVDVTLIEGRTATLVVEPGAPVDVPAPQALVMPSPIAGRRRADVNPPPHAVEDSSPGPWIVGGVGVTALIVGATAGAIVIQKKGVANAHCTDGPPPTCRDQAGLDAASAVRTLGPVTTASLLVGAAGLTAGAVWLGVRRTDKSSVRVGVSPTLRGASWRLEGSW